jgi:hypothetical protein
LPRLPCPNGNRNTEQLNLCSTDCQPLGIRMELTESDPSLTEVCRRVEACLGHVSYLHDVDLSVILFQYFNDLKFPVTPRDPTAYNRLGDRIFVNTRVFPSLLPEIAQFALPHEIGHHAHDVGITASAPGFKGVHPCLVAEWLASQWGFTKEMRIERLPTRGQEFPGRLSTIRRGRVPHVDHRLRTKIQDGPIDPSTNCSSIENSAPSS